VGSVSGGCRMRIKEGLKQWRCWFARRFNGDLRFCYSVFSGKSY
jgi:hypothetical protein